MFLSLVMPRKWRETVMQWLKVAPGNINVIRLVKLVPERKIPFRLCEKLLSEDSQV